MNKNALERLVKVVYISYSIRWYFVDAFPLELINKKKEKGGHSNAIVTVAAQDASAVSAATIIQSWGPNYSLGRTLIRVLTFRRIGFQKLELRGKTWCYSIHDIII